MPPAAEGKFRVRIGAGALSHNTTPAGRALSRFPHPIGNAGKFSKIAK